MRRRALRQPIPQSEGPPIPALPTSGREIARNFPPPPLPPPRARARPGTQSGRSPPPRLAWYAVADWHTPAPRCLARAFCQSALGGLRGRRPSRRDFNRRAGGSDGLIPLLLIRRRAWLLSPPPPILTPHGACGRATRPAPPASPTSATTAPPS